MASIGNLTEINEFTSSNVIAVAIGQNDRKITGSNFLDWITSSLNLDGKKDSFTTQYSSPNAEAFNITVNDSSIVSNNSNAWLIVTPNAGYTDMTITLPTYGDLEDKQEVLVICTQGITNLTISATGTILVGVPTSLTANDSFRLKYDMPFKTWYKVG